MKYWIVMLVYVYHMFILYLYWRYDVMLGEPGEFVGLRWPRKLPTMRQPAPGTVVGHSRQPALGTVVEHSHSHQASPEIQSLQVKTERSRKGEEIKKLRLSGWSGSGKTKDF